MKKRLVVSILAGIMAVCTLTGCGGSTGTTGTTPSTGSSGSTGTGLTEVVESTESDASSSADSSASSDGVEKKIFRIGIECTYAPYNWTQETEDLADGEKAVKITNSDGYTYGYDVALAQKICDELGWTLEVYKSDWTSIFMGLEDKTYDCIMSGVCYTAERDEIYDFTSPYYERQIMAVVREDSEFANVTKLSDFEGMNPTVIAQLGTNFVDYKSQIPSGVAATDYESVSELFLAIQNSTADILITEKSTADSALQSMTGLKQLELSSDDGFVAPEGSPNTCCILFRGGDAECEIINGALESLGWTNETKEGLAAMNDLMSKMIELQPSAGE